jgi:hypothetical protein
VTAVRALFVAVLVFIVLGLTYMISIGVLQR